MRVEIDEEIEDIVKRAQDRAVVRPLQTVDGFEAVLTLEVGELSGEGPTPEDARLALTSSISNIFQMVAELVARQ